MISRLERLALQRRMRITPQMRIILQILDVASEPPTAQEIYQCAQASGASISLSTIRRTLSGLTGAGLLRRLGPSGHQAGYAKAEADRKDYLVDAATGRRLPFRSEGIEELLKHAVNQLGYRLLDYRLELVGVADGAWKQPGRPSSEPRPLTPASHSSTSAGSATRTKRGAQRARRRLGH